uniref:ATP-dependent DNA ligase family profile domain-containing protein n=1 Tax=Arcella intermedia TaxID=1963864 RepID=A0A6B2LB68_9EUKA
MAISSPKDITPPSLQEDGKLAGDKVAAFMMHGRDWDGSQDPSGWIMSEKLDGVRAFWNGSKLYSKNGKELPVPAEFTSTLPKDVFLDGEIWVGYDTLSKLTSILKKSVNMKNEPTRGLLWKDVRYCVFDSPMHPGNYQERHAHAAEAVSECGTNIHLIPIEFCSGLDHLQNKLDQIVELKGEGIMLYNPEATYSSGRNSNILKVKMHLEEDVTFLECNPNSYSFKCQQSNGIQCMVKCSSWDYTHPPPNGTSLTVRHNGYFKTSRKIKYPFLLRINQSNSII